MDKKKPSQDGRGNVRYLWVLVGGYLLYLAYQQMLLLLEGEASKPTDAAICVVSAIVFALAGAWVIYREWEAWRYAQAHKDDPQTGDEAPELADADEVSEADTDADEAEAVGEDETEETS
jgi:ABC-type nickel/cobalt efflux system permease component RcnA